MGKGQPSLQGQLRKNHCCTCSRIIYLCIGLWPFHHDRIISLDSVITRNIIDALIFEILSHLWHHKNSWHQWREPKWYFPQDSSDLHFNLASTVEWLGVSSDCTNWAREILEKSYRNPIEIPEKSQRNPREISPLWNGWGVSSDCTSWADPGQHSLQLVET